MCVVHVKPLLLHVIDGATCISGFDEIQHERKHRGVCLTRGRYASIHMLYFCSLYMITRYVGHWAGDRLLHLFDHDLTYFHEPNTRKYSRRTSIVHEHYNSAHIKHVTKIVVREVAKVCLSPFINPHNTCFIIHFLFNYVGP